MAVEPNSIKDERLQSLDHAKANHVLAVRCRDWESDICDISTMSAVLTEYVEHAFDSCHDTERGPSVYLFSNDHVDRMMFMIHHLRGMILEFRKEYYAALHGEA